MRRWLSRWWRFGPREDRRLPDPGRRAIVEWALLSMALVAFVVVSGPLFGPSGGEPRADPSGASALATPIGSLNLFIYDLALAHDADMADPSIVIVAIDDMSLAQIGRWPWRRAILAALVEQIGLARPAVLAIDVLFAEPEIDSRGDETLARALARASARGTRVALAVGKDVVENSILPIYPIAELLGQSVLAHVALEPSADGLVRGFNLFEGHLPALAHVMADPMAAPDMAASSRMVASGRWDRAGGRLIGSLAGSIEHIPAAQILRGEVDLARFSDRRVMIGSTAVGAGDQFASPIYRNRLNAGGVELHAAAASALLRDHLKSPIEPGLHAVLSTLLVLATMNLLYLTRPGVGFVITVVMLGAIVFATVLMFRLNLWIPPGAILVAVAIAYPLWSWRRLTAASAGLMVQARNLDFGSMIFYAPRAESESLEPISARLTHIQNAAGQVRRLNRFLMDSLQSLPHPILIADQSLSVLLANQKLSLAFGQSPAAGTPMIEWLDKVFGSVPDGVQNDPTRLSGERRDRTGRQWLVDVRLTGGGNDDVRWLLQLVDISPLREAEREREEALSFLSHDLRSPQATILAMIERARSANSSNGSVKLGIPGEPSDPSGPSLDLSEIERQSRRALALIDGFLAYARADAKAIAYQDSDLCQLVTEVIDLGWFSAQARQIRLTASGVEEAPTFCDTELIRRALTNLVENAIRHCREGGEVVVEVTAEPAHYLISVADQGPGVPFALRNRIFLPFWQASQSELIDAHDNGGEAIDHGAPDSNEHIGNVANGSADAAFSVGRAGLGLAMVQKAITRHEGTITLSDPPNATGAVFVMRLPKRPTAIIQNGFAGAGTQPYDGSDRNPRTDRVSDR